MRNQLNDIKPQDIMHKCGAVLRFQCIKTTTQINNMGDRDNRTSKHLFFNGEGASYFVNGILQTKLEIQNVLQFHAEIVICLLDSIDVLLPDKQGIEMLQRKYVFQKGDGK